MKSIINHQFNIKQTHAKTRNDHKQIIQNICILMLAILTNAFKFKDGFKQALLSAWGCESIQC